MTSESSVKECFIEIGAKRHIKNTVFRNEKRIDIREYDDAFPTKKGVSMTLQSWADLVGLADTIEQKVTELARGLRVQEKYHIGHNIFVSMNSDFNNCVDIRHWWLPESSDEERGEVKATKRGLALSIPQWHKLRDCMKVLPDYLPELKDMKTCALSDSHQNQLGYLKCNHCNPNGERLWTEF